MYTSIASWKRPWAVAGKISLLNKIVHFKIDRCNESERAREGERERVWKVIAVDWTATVSRLLAYLALQWISKCQHTSMGCWRQRRRRWRKSTLDSISFLFFVFESDIMPHAHLQLHRKIFNEMALNRTVAPHPTIFELVFCFGTLCLSFDGGSFSMKGCTVSMLPPESFCIFKLISN